MAAQALTATPRPAYQERAQHDDARWTCVHVCAYHDFAELLLGFGVDSPPVGLLAQRLRHIHLPGAARARTTLVAVGVGPNPLPPNP